MTQTQSAPIEFRYVRPPLYAEQYNAIFDPRDRDGNVARFSIIEASTKSGKTAGCMVWLLEQALAGRAGQNFWWVAPILAQAKIAFRRYLRMLPPAAIEVNKTDVTITLPNGATIWFKGSDNPDSLYGEDVYAAVVDEASRCKADTWYSVRSTLTATRGPARIIGNVKGRKNWAYELGRRALHGEASLSYHKITAFDAVRGGVLDPQEILDARRQLPDDVFRELYLAIPTDDGSNPFGIAAIKAAAAPMSDEPPAAIGIDLGRKIDFTALLGLDRAGRWCGFDHYRLPWPETMARIRRVVGDTPALVDATGLGDPVFSQLQRPPNAAQQNNYAPFIFTAPSKQQLFEGLAVAIQQREITIPASGVLRQELEDMEFQVTRTHVKYAAPEGLHDDAAVALALAVKHWRDLGSYGVAAAGQGVGGGGFWRGA